MAASSGDGNQLALAAATGVQRLLQDGFGDPSSTFYYHPLSEAVPWGHGHDYSFGWSLLTSFLVISILTNLISIAVARRLRRRELRAGYRSSTYSLFICECAGVPRRWRGQRM